MLGGMTSTAFPEDGNLTGRNGLSFRVPDSLWSILPALQRANLTNAFSRFGPRGLSRYARGQPWGEDLMTALQGVFGNKIRGYGSYLNRGRAGDQQLRAFVPNGYQATPQPVPANPFAGGNIPPELLDFVHVVGPAGTMGSGPIPSYAPQPQPVPYVPRGYQPMPTSPTSGGGGAPRLGKPSYNSLGEDYGQLVMNQLLGNSYNF